MIPMLIDVGSGAPWAVLPPGIHDVTIADIADRFATTPHRRWLFEGFLRVVEALEAANCPAIYLDGSFTTAKDHPGDFDGCWDHTGMDFTKLDPVLKDFSGKREAQKAKYLGEMFPAFAPNGASGTFLGFFQIEKFSGQPKGILRLTLPIPKGATT
ncbi:MAG: hypothetical protein KKA16_03125 [Alphaproteobacteria bacterium]|nr:hypothetical protein [Alphaproteobacteria bacterium]MBU2378221.1 hypothetical protein [Alphaproteobacteria bacterium]